MDRKKPLPCDQCHRRKVRCDYERPCLRCNDAQVECTYAVVRKKRGPKSGRRTLSTSTASPAEPVISSRRGPESMHLDRLLDPPTVSTVEGSPLGVAPDESTRVFQAEHNAISFDEFAQNVLSGATGITEESTGGRAEAVPILPTAPLQFQSVVAPPFGRRLERDAVIDQCVDLFYSDLYPTYPLISRSYVDTCLNHPADLFRSDIEMIWGMCALTLAHVDNWPDLTPEERTLRARRFIRKIRESRVDWDLDSPCYTDILTSLFISVAFFEPRGKTASWLSLRESISVAHALQFEKEETYRDLDSVTAVLYRRVYALLFITERGSAIMYSTPPAILLPPSLPQVILPEESPSISVGLQSLHSLFALLDMKFVDLWNDTSLSSTSAADTNESNLSLLQHHLREVVLDHPGLTETQRADILITREWLRLLIWHAALKQGFVSSTPADPCLGYAYPIEIGMCLCEVVKRLPPSAIAVHGLGIFEKQFEIAYSMQDALQMSQDAAPKQHESLRYLLLSLSLSPTSRQIYVRTLEKAMTGNVERTMAVGQKYRSLHDVQLLVDDTPSRQASRRPSLAVIRS